MCGAATGALPEPTPRRPVQTPGTGKTCAQMHYMAIFRQYWGTVVLYDMSQAIMCAQLYYMEIFRQWFLHSCIVWQSSGNDLCTVVFYGNLQAISFTHFLVYVNLHAAILEQFFYMTFFIQWFVHIRIIWQSSGPNFLTVVLYGNLQAILVQICSQWNSLGRGMYPFVVYVNT